MIKQYSFETLQFGKVQGCRALVEAEAIDTALERTRKASAQFGWKFYLLYAEAALKHNVLKIEEV